MVMQAELDRRVQHANHAWQRTSARLAYRLANRFYPLICRGYNRRQNVLINGFVDALNALQMNTVKPAAAI